MVDPRWQFVRYGGVGGLAFVLDFALLLLLVALGMHYLSANVAAFLAANTLNFWLGQRLVFSAGSRLPTAYHAYGAVLLISVIGLGVNTVVLFAAVELGGLGLIAAKLLATVAALLWNFGARKRWVYV